MLENSQSNRPLKNHQNISNCTKQPASRTEPKNSNNLQDKSQHKIENKFDSLESDSRSCPLDTGKLLLR